MLWLCLILMQSCDSYGSYLSQACIFTKSVDCAQNMSSEGSKASYNIKSTGFRTHHFVRRNKHVQEDLKDVRVEITDVLEANGFTNVKNGGGPTVTANWEQYGDI